MAAAFHLRECGAHGSEGAVPRGAGRFNRASVLPIRGSLRPFRGLARRRTVAAAAHPDSWSDLPAIPPPPGDSSQRRIGRRRRAAGRRVAHPAQAVREEGLLGDLFLEGLFLHRQRRSPAKTPPASASFSQCVRPPADATRTSSRVTIFGTSAICLRVFSKPSIDPSNERMFPWLWLAMYFMLSSHIV